MLGGGGAAMKRTASSDRLAAAAAAAVAVPAPPQHASRQQRRLALRFKGHRLGLPVPSEMWGAASLAVRMAQFGGSGSGSGSGGQMLLPRPASVIAQAFSTAAGTPAPTCQVSEDNPKALAEALDWRPQLSSAEDLACLLLPAAACAAVYAATAPSSAQPLYAAGMAVLYALLIAALRTFLLERRHQAVLRSERDLAASDSIFFESDGIHLHYKRHTPLRSTSGGKGGGGGNGAGPPAAVVHCLHGFGASSYSWSFVQQELADALHAVVTAHDMPGFGLSQRPRSSRYYTLHYNGEAARRIMDAELAAAQQAPAQQQQAEPAAEAGGSTAAGGQQQGQQAQQGAFAQEWRSHPISTSSSSSSLASSGGGIGKDGTADGIDNGSGTFAAATQQQEGERRQQQQQHHHHHQRAPRRVLIGHSMGGAVAAEGVISSPEGIDALVLVAPAIVALWMGPPEEAAGDPVATGLAVVEELVGAEDEPGEIQRLPSAASSSNGSSGQLLSRSNSGASSSSSGSSRSFGSRAVRAARTVAAVGKAVLLLAVRLLLAACTPLLVLVLRRLIRNRRFWERGLVSAWHDGSRVTRQYVDAYRSGQLVRGWEGGILRFLAARFGEKHGFWGSIREAVQGDGHLTQAERLARAVRRHGIRVLIVHGAGDALVPAANSRRLAAILPNAELVVFDKCGHMPQEECPDQFVETVQQFVASLD